MLNPYQNTAAIESAVNDGAHRTVVGGMWDGIGRLQFDLLRRFGLAPGERLLDIGCGCFRGGNHFIAYLEPGHYYGTDINAALIEAGVRDELEPAGLAARVPAANLLVDDGFRFERLQARFDRALAFSVFTHMPLNSVRVCLEKLAPVMAIGGTFHATFFELPDGTASYEEVRQPPGEIVTHGDRDPYHYRLADFEQAASGLPWRVEHVGDVDHPRGQKLINFVRVPEDGAAGEATASSSSATRLLSRAQADQLPAGAEHYRAYVGPPGRYDFMSATQFALLFQLGLKDTDTVLDFGCGSLRLGRLLIPFLQPGRYFGLDPNKWLIDDAVDRELGRHAIALKQPTFAYNDDFDSSVFGRQFDFVMAQSIVTHTGPDLVRAMLAPLAQVLAPDGLFLFSYIRKDDAAETGCPPPGWHYPHCVAYTDNQLIGELEAAGLDARPIPWFHPAASWMVAARKTGALPSQELLNGLNGSILRTR